MILSIILMVQELDILPIKMISLEEIVMVMVIQLRQVRKIGMEFIIRIPGCMKPGPIFIMQKTN